MMWQIDHVVSNYSQHKFLGSQLLSSFNFFTQGTLEKHKQSYHASKRVFLCKDFVGYLYVQILLEISLQIVSHKENTKSSP